MTLSNLSTKTTSTTNFLSLYSSGSVANCTSLYLLEPGEGFSVRSEGQLHHDGYGDTWGYCVETRVIEMLRDIMVLKCQEEKQCHRDNTKYHSLFTVLGMISLVFLSITFIVYISVPKLFNLQGKILISNITSIFLVTLYLLIVYNITPTSSVFCIVLGYFGYFVSISMFGWMTVICLDLSWTFCRSPIPRTGSDSSKLLSFSMIAWGLATLLTALVFCLDLTLPDRSEWKPNIGKSSCFIEDAHHKRMVFFHIPVLVFMFINLILFFLTIYNLHHHSKQTREVRLSRR